MIHTPRRMHTQRGFTFVEIAIIAPIVILTIGAFITVVVSMTGDVLISRATTQLQYNVQDALNRIDQDVKQSSTFLAETNIALTSPQGYGDDTTVFDNVDSTKGMMLILNTLATTGNPLASTSSIAYLSNSPNACGTLQGQNTPMSLNVVYFVKNNSLWRRTIMPSNYATAACNNTGTGTAAPWQQPSCTTVGGFCKTLDEDLVDGVSTSGFTVQYYNSSSTSTENTTASANPTCNTTTCVTARNGALASSTTVNVTIDAHQTIASKDVEQAISLQSTRSDVNATSIATVPAPTIPSVPSVTGKSNTTGISSTSTIAGKPTFSWNPSTGGGTITYSLQYRINGGSWSSTVTIPGSGAPSYTIPTVQFGKTVDVQVQASNAAGTSTWSSAATVAVPVYATPQLQNGWQNYVGTGYSGGLYATAGFTRSSAGVVSLKGLIQSGSGVMFTLPVGFRPAEQEIFAVDGTGAAGRLDIYPDGTVQLPSGTGTYVALNDVHFTAAPPDGPSYTTSSTSGSMTLINSWATYGSPPWATPAYLIDTAGRVQIKGLVKSGAGRIWANPSASFAQAENSYLPSLGGNNGYAEFSVQNAANGNGVTYVAGTNSYITMQNMYYPSGATTWTSFTPSGSWVYYGAPYTTTAYTKGNDGIVSVKGFIRSGTVTGGTVIGNLPAGYRPSLEMMFEVSSADAFGRIDILPNGNIVIGAANVAWLSLDNINFQAEQ
jgi:hypothetical protein